MMHNQCTKSREDLCFTDRGGFQANVKLSTTSRVLKVRSSILGRDAVALFPQSLMAIIQSGSADWKREWQKTIAGEAEKEYKWGVRKKEMSVEWLDTLSLCDSESQKQWILCESNIWHSITTQWWVGKGTFFCQYLHARKARLVTYLGVPEV